MEEVAGPKSRGLRTDPGRMIPLFAGPAAAEWPNKRNCFCGSRFARSLACAEHAHSEPSSAVSRTMRYPPAQFRSCEQPHRHTHLRKHTHRDLGVLEYLFILLHV
jgi:hypothetical protein